MSNTDAPVTMGRQSEIDRLRDLIQQVRTAILFDIEHNNDRVMAWQLRFLELSKPDRLPEMLRDKAIDLWTRQIREAHGNDIDRLMSALRGQCPYSHFCRHPPVCAGRGSCPRDLACSE
jgi:hypothetical protein